MRRTWARTKQAESGGGGGRGAYRHVPQRFTAYWARVMAAGVGLNTSDKKERGSVGLGPIYVGEGGRGGRRERKKKKDGQ